jgi:hypothetical protein
MSAAYLLASAARTVSIDQMAEAGSVGVISVHQEMSKMLKDIGITPTVMRSGKYKALGNPYEPLTDEAKAEIQGQLDQLYGIFVQHVADHRGVTYATADQKMAQGRVFIGERAKEVGLVDSVTSFDALMTKVQGGIDSSRAKSKYGSNSTNTNNKGSLVSKSAMTEQSIAALAEGGGALASADAGHGGGSGGSPAKTPEEIAAAEKDAADKLAADKEADEKAAAVKPVEPTALQVVQTQLASAQAQVTELTIELRDAKRESESIKGSHASMRAIVLASTQRLKVALGQTAGGEDALDDAALLACHTALRETFETKFKAGGVAAVSAGEDTKNKGQDVVADAHRQLRIKATRPSK